MVRLVIDRCRPGFSLLEILVVLVLIGLLVAIAVPSIDALTGVEVGKSARKLQGLIKEVYTRAALSGQVNRIIYDLDNNTVWVEESAKDFKLDIESGNDVSIQSEPAAKGKKPAFKKVTGELGEDWKLAARLRIRGVWTEHLTNRQKSGKVAQYFFAGGVAETAQITLGREGQDFGLTVVVEALTGETYVVDSEPTIPTD